MDVVAMLFVGIGLGIVTSVPIGPVAGVVVQLALRHDRRAALLCGLGCAVVDGLYSFGAAMGVAQLLERVPRIVPYMFTGSGVVLTILGIWTLRDTKRRPPEAAGVDPLAAPEVVGKKRPPRKRAFFSGVALSVTNPVPLIAWVGLSGTVLAAVSRTAVPFFSLGVCAGVVAWFAGISELAVRGKGKMTRHLAKVSRAIGIALLVSAALCFWRAVTHYGG